MYSMKGLSSRVKRTPQALYKLIKQNDALSSIVKENITKDGRFIKYGEPVLQWLMDYYQIQQPLTEDEAGEDIVEPAQDEIPQHTPTTSPIEADLRIELVKLQTENEALKIAVEALKSDLERERAEKREMSERLGISLLALREEQQKVKLYLPAPRKTLKERFKSFFVKERPPEDMDG